jgi:hypothetical protein
VSGEEHLIDLPALAADRLGWTADEVATMLGITRVEVLRQRRLGRLPSVKINRTTFLFTPEHLRQYLTLCQAAERRVPPGTGLPILSPAAQARARKRLGLLP